MTDVFHHYDAHLGPIYTWMLGDLAAALAGARADLNRVGIAARAGALAVDLGAGPGVYAIPLAELGYTVLAIDACAGLLNELTTHAGNLPIQPILDDLAQFRRHLTASPDVVLCMGDTLTHLPSHAVVEALVADVAAALAPGGTFVATFRDYSGALLEGPARFIPVRSDEDRILTCFLEAETATLRVHDLLHQRVEGQWRQTVSAYRKLRISPKSLQESLQTAGLTTTVEPGPRGMILVVGQRVP